MVEKWFYDTCTYIAYMEFIIGLCLQSLSNRHKDLEVEHVNGKREKF